MRWNRFWKPQRKRALCGQAYVLVRLPYEVKTLFRDWLTEHFPDRAAHVMSLINDMRGGKDNDPNFGSRMKGTGPVAELTTQSVHDCLQATRPGSSEEECPATH